MKDIKDLINEAITSVLAGDIESSEMDALTETVLNSYKEGYLEGLKEGYRRAKNMYYKKSN